MPANTAATVVNTVIHDASAAAGVVANAAYTIAHQAENTVVHTFGRSPILAEEWVRAGGPSQQ